MHIYERYSDVINYCRKAVQSRLFVGLPIRIIIPMAPFLFFTTIYVNNVAGIFIDSGFYSRRPFFHTK